MRQAFGKEAFGPGQQDRTVMNLTLARLDVEVARDGNALGTGDPAMVSLWFKLPQGRREAIDPPDHGDGAIAGGPHVLDVGVEPLRRDPA